MARTALAALFSLCAFALTGAYSHAAVDQRRVALVIANSEYTHTTPLNNPKNDGRDLVAALRRLEFKVIEGFDLDQSGMRSKIREFTTAIDGADVALFYYAGHGLQVDGKNYLAPVSAKLQRESDLDFETISLNLVLRQMERERRTNLVFLDACRDNPLTQRLARSMATRSTAVGRGLARVQSGVGMLIGYATSPGMVALDGQGRNSPYAQALLKHIEEPGIGINDLMIKVRQDVLAASRGKQVPWEHSSLTGSFVFKEQDKVKTAASTTSPTTGETPQATTTTDARVLDIARERSVSAAFQATVSVGTCGAYKAFEEQHRGTFYARLAEEWITTNCAASGRAIAVEAAEEPAKKTSVDKTPEKTAAAEPKPVKVASADPAVTPKDETATKLTGAPLVVALQKELDRVGCDPGKADGKWGGKTTRALKNFNRYAKLSLSTTAPDSAALAMLKSKAGRICPLRCGARFEAKGDSCVKKTCPAGKTLTRRGSCVVVAKKAPPRQATPKKRAPAAKKRKAPKQDQFWGGEDDRVDCERGLLTDRCFAPR